MSLQHAGWVHFALTHEFDETRAGLIKAGGAATLSCEDLDKQEKLKQLLEQLEKERLKVNSTAYARLLRVCGSSKFLAEGKRVHKHIIQSGLEGDTFVGNHLVQMYLSCGSLQDACEMFDRMSERDAVLWTSMISAYCQRGYPQTGLQHFYLMQNEGVMPDKITLLTVLCACDNPGALVHGKRIHACILECGFQEDVVLATALVGMYGKCGSLKDAHETFSKMPEQNVVSWTSLISSFAGKGHYKECLQIFRHMQLEGVTPNKVTFVTILGACVAPSMLQHGKLIQNLITEMGVESDVLVGTALVTMYARCGELQGARCIFDGMHGKNVVSWNAMITECAEQGYLEEAVTLFRQMQLQGMLPDKVTFVAILNVCASTRALADGRFIHMCTMECGYEMDVSLQNVVIFMYGKCRSIEEARSVFDRMHQPNVISWTAILAAYVNAGFEQEAFHLFRQMQLEGIIPDKIAFVEVLNACCSPEALANGKLVHRLIVEGELQQDAVVKTALVKMYGNCGSTQDARNLFSKDDDLDPVLWTAIIASYGDNGEWKAAIQLFYEMQLEGLRPDKVAVITALTACSNLDEGKLIHACIVETGFNTDIIVGTALVNMYGRCGDLQEAKTIFDELPEKEVISWNALIAVDAQNWHEKEALKLFVQMQLEGFRPTEVTIIIVLTACASIAALAVGKSIHARVAECGLASDIIVQNALVSMYGRCGLLEDAIQVFAAMEERNLSSWNTIIAVHAECGHAKEAVQLLTRMQQSGVAADTITFVSILSACSHAGLLEDGLNYFMFMRQAHGILPTAEHYGCIVDILGRAGWLEEAEDFIVGISSEANDARMWITLLGACRIHHDTERAKRAAKHAMELESGESAAYVMLSNVYTACELKEGKHAKEPSLIDMAHEFVVHDKSHPQTKKLYAELERLRKEMQNSSIKLVEEHEELLESFSSSNNWLAKV